MFREEVGLRAEETLSPDLLLPSNEPREERVGDVFDRRVFDVRERRPREVRDLVRWHPEPATDFGNLELPSLQELRVVRGDRYRVELHPLFEDRHAPVVRRAAMNVLPRLPEVLLSFFAEDTGVFEDALRHRRVPEERGSELLRRRRETEGLPRPRDHRVADETVESQSLDVNDVVREDRPNRERVRVIEDVDDRAGRRRSPDRDPVGFEGPEIKRVPESVSFDLDEAVPVGERVSRDRRPEVERAHLGVRFVVKEPIDRMPPDPLLAATLGLPVDDQGEFPDVLRDRANAREDRRDRQRVLLVDIDAGRIRIRVAEEEPFEPRRRIRDRPALVRRGATFRP